MNEYEYLHWKTAYRRATELIEAVDHTRDAEIIDDEIMQNPGAEVAVAELLMRYMQEDGLA